MELPPERDLRLGYVRAGERRVVDVVWMARHRGCGSRKFALKGRRRIFIDAAFAPLQPSTEIALRSHTWRSSRCSGCHRLPTGTRRGRLPPPPHQSSPPLAAALLLLAASPPPPRPARAGAGPGPEDIDEARVVRLFQEASPSVVFIKDLVVGRPPVREGGQVQAEDDEEVGAMVEGTGSGFVWDTAGHIVTNYHVVAKLAGDGSSFHRCKVFLEDSSGNSYSKEGRLIGCDPSYDLAVLKVDVDGDKLRPSLIGTSKGLRAGQSCFAIGNPSGYEHMLTTRVVSGLGREIPSPNGRPIRGAIQTDAAINSGVTSFLVIDIWTGLSFLYASRVQGHGPPGNSGGPLIDSYGHVIGVNTATFTRKGTGISSGVNFAIPIDTVVQSVPNLIVYGTSVSNRF